jgi:3-oxoacyl-(acyl-carrier-protein) synthase
MAKYDGPIVITGTGAVSPFGLGSDAVWSALLQGERQTTVVEPTEPYKQTVLASKVGTLPFADLLGKRGLQYLRPCTQFLLGASTLAIQAAGLADGGSILMEIHIYTYIHHNSKDPAIHNNATEISWKGRTPHYMKVLLHNTVLNLPGSYKKLFDLL